MAQRIVIRDIQEYARLDLAGTFKSTAGTQPAAPAELVERAMESLANDGYVVIPGLLETELVAQVREEMLALLPSAIGRNTFEGFRTQRVYAVIEKTFACNPIVEHPLVLGVIDRLLEPNYLLSALQAINIQPGEDQQPLHYDDAFYPWPRPRRALGVATIWAIDPFTEDNGATVVIPGSHLWPDRNPAPADLEHLQPVVMPPGSLLLFVGTLWHAGGANRSAHPRMCVTAQYCAPYLRQQENFALSISRERVAQCSEHVQRLLGYSIHAPFMGAVDGMHPKRLIPLRENGQSDSTIELTRSIRSK